MLATTQIVPSYHSCLLGRRLNNKSRSKFYLVQSNMEMLWSVH
uniref:Uncharacterized protein n=1 Tax=Rhizophora mucronata TaxID=61149 RepID=A0A2P2QV82_RHIMU